MDEIKIPTDSDLEKQALEFLENGKGRPPRAIAGKVKELRQAHALLNKTVQGKKAANAVVETPKMEQFLEEFLKNGGNATQAALSVFNCSSIESAAVMGSTYLKKAKGMARVMLEKQGYGYGKMLEVAAKKMEESKTPEWWDRLMKMSEYEDFLSKPKQMPTLVNIVGAQKKIASDFGFGDEEVIDGEEA